MTIINALMCMEKKSTKYLLMLQHEASIIRKINEIPQMRLSDYFDKIDLITSKYYSIMVTMFTTSLIFSPVSFCSIIVHIDRIFCLVLIKFY